MAIDQLCAWPGDLKGYEVSHFKELASEIKIGQKPTNADHTCIFYTAHMIVWALYVSTINCENSRTVNGQGICNVVRRRMTTLDYN